MSVPIEFDKPRTLKFDLAAIRDLEATMDGKPLASIIHDIIRSGINATVIALWAGLKHEDRTLNLNLVTRMLDAYLKRGGSLDALAGALNDAFDETCIFKKEGDPGNEKPERASV